MGIFGKLVIFCLLLFFAVTPQYVLAQTTTDSAKVLNPFETLREKILERRENVQEKRQEVREKITAKRDEQKVKRCEVKEKVLTNRINSLNRLVTNIEDKFSAIVERVKAHYTNKVLPTGRTVENYDSYLADIDTKKAAVDSALASAKTNANTFTCDSDDPKAQLTQFKEDMQAVKAALKDYKTAIRNLIVAVKSITGQESSEQTNE